MIQQGYNLNIDDQLYLEALVSETYPVVKVNDINPFSFAGKAGDLGNDNTLFYGVVSCSPLQGDSSHIGQPSVAVDIPLQDFSDTHRFPLQLQLSVLAPGASWRGLFWKLYSLHPDDFVIHFVGFKIQFDNIPKGVLVPVPPVTQVVDVPVGPPPFTSAIVEFAFYFYDGSHLKGRILADPACGQFVLNRPAPAPDMNINDLFTLPFASPGNYAMVPLRQNADGTDQLNLGGAYNIALDPSVGCHFFVDSVSVMMGVQETLRIFFHSHVPYRLISYDLLDAQLNDLLGFDKDIIPGSGMLGNSYVDIRKALATDFHTIKFLRYRMIYFFQDGSSFESPEQIYQLPNF